MAAKTNAFLELLKSDKYYDRIYDAVFSFCCGHKNNIVLDHADGYDISRIASIEDATLNYQNVFIDDKGNSNIEFDIGIEVELECEGVSGKYHDHDSYSSSFWVIVSCRGNLDKKLDDFKIYAVEEYSRSKPTKPLSGDMIPFIKREDYHRYAEELLSKYYPEALNDATQVDVYKLASNMGLRVYDVSLSEDCSIFGQVFFDDTEIELFDRSKGEVVKRKVEAGTILYDSMANFLYSFGTQNLTIAHECVHYYLHKKAFKFAQLLNDELKYIQCKVSGGIVNADSSTTSWMEIQANAIAPYILMPNKTFGKEAEMLMDIYSMQRKNVLAYMPDVIRDLADEFGVSVYAARKRLIDLGYESAIGVLNWIDDGYVRPYSFKAGSLGINETFTVSFKDVYEKIISEPSISKYIFTDRVEFVENHLCINNSKYITKDDQGNSVLTDYALTHMDECCVKFVCKVANGIVGDSDFGLTCYLCRDCSKEIEFDLILNKQSLDIYKNAELNKRYQTHIENIEIIKKGISAVSFPEALDYIMDFLAIEEVELSIDSGLDERTIRRYRNGEAKELKKRTVIAIIRGLNVPQVIATELLKDAGITLTNSKDDNVLYTVLGFYRTASPSQVNSFLTSVGCEPLTKTE